jgi:uncharacterized membrane protein
MKFTQLINLILGNPTTSKVRLAKKPTRDDHIRSLNCWIERNFYLIVLACMIFLLIAFVLVCFAIVGVSAVESGVPYNHIGDII